MDDGLLDDVDSLEMEGLPPQRLWILGFQIY